MKEKQLDFFKASYLDCRKEIQMRITQRDHFAIQEVVAICALLTIGFTSFDYALFAFLIMPIISVFYTIQILYSYSMHKRLHNFLKELESKIAELLDYQGDVDKLFWESNCETNKDKEHRNAVGKRKLFFSCAAFAVPIIGCLLFLYRGLNEKVLGNIAVIVIVAVACFLYLSVTTAIFLFARKGSKKNA
ncbi:MAG: hypothetical protein IJ735_03325 [Clostridia bacterium]|nr:hypothetical protein [Clostridia bacterium]